MLFIYIHICFSYIYVSVIYIYAFHIYICFIYIYFIYIYISYIYIYFIYIYIYICCFSCIIFHHGLSQESKYSSLFCTVGPHSLFIHSKCNRLYLLIPNSPSIPLPPLLPLGNNRHYISELFRIFIFHFHRYMYILNTCRQVLLEILDLAVHAKIK